MAAPPLDLSTLNRVNAIAVAYWTMILVWTFVVTVVWFARGPDHPLVALFTSIGTFALTPGVAVPLVQRLSVRWYEVPAGERLLHRMLGVGFFGRLLERSGWNRNNAYLSTSLTRTRLPLRADAARGGIAAHGFCFLPTQEQGFHRAYLKPAEPCSMSVRGAGPSVRSKTVVCVLACLVGRRRS